MTSFAFTPVQHPKFGILLRPFLRVRLIGPQHNVWQRMLLDSGADFTTLPATLADHLGYSLPSEPSGHVKGIAGVPLPYVVGEIDIEVGGISYHVRLAWVRSERAPALLGRLDFFRLTDYVTNERPPLRVLGQVCGDRAMLWLQNTEHTWFNAREGRPIPPAAPTEAVLRGFADGEWAVEVWDTVAGTVVGRSSVRASGGELRLALPETPADVAMKFRCVQRD